MSFTVINCAQRSPEWYQARLGRLTGSAVGDVIAQRKKGTGELKARADLRRRIVAERLTGLSLDDLPFTPFDVQRGVELEPLAFAAYEAVTGLCAERVGFVQHGTLMLGCSPDGRIGEWEGCLELKCPKANTHLSYVQAGVIPDEYLGQCLMGCYLTGAPWWDFCSFHPDFPVGLDLFRVRLEPTAEALKLFDDAVRTFLAECDRDEAAVRALVKAVA